MKGLPHYRGERGELELLLEGAVRREAADRGERIYELSELGELLGELAAISADERPPDDMVGVTEIGALVIDKALA